MQLAVIVVVGADAPAPVLRRVARLGRQIGEAAIHLPVQVVSAVARQVAGIVDLQLVAEMHGDHLLAPAVIHLVVGPDRGAGSRGCCRRPASMSLPNTRVRTFQRAVGRQL